MRLKELRKENNITQEEIAKRIGTSRVNYNRYEVGQIEPNIDILIKLANQYDVSLDYLIGRQFKNDIGYITNDEKELITDYRKLNQINKIKILAELKGFLIAQN